ncbi:MAG TPA: TlpA disulfide reductase family protein [Cyclobacteriaceae bacterium]|nr:TlpA disulfide reductase family protein [Cyclobacteriaceae bacterium]HRK52693.1 TlpA disulfide reductase family protein [Cyclobacteriaceae bacterium]
MKNKFMLYALMFVAALLIPGCSAKQSDLDKIQLQTLDGLPIDMNDFKGKTVFINFWATWCKPCIMEMPTIAQAKEQLNGKNVVFLFPSNESVDLITDFKEKRNFDFNYVQVQNMEALNIQALPTTMIFNTEGELVFSEMGFRDWSTPENLALITSNK